MLFGISGSAGCGKTTVAKQVAEDLGILFRPTSITECARRHGFDPVAPMSLTQRVALQKHLLEDHLEMIDGETRPLIVDRTPIDMLGYMLGEMHMQSHQELPGDVLNQVAKYAADCLEATVKHYDQVFVLSPLANYEVSGKRPAENPAYQLHTHFLMLGGVMQISQRINGFAIINETDLQFRLDTVHDTLTARMDQIETEKRASAHIH